MEFQELRKLYDDKFPEEYKCLLCKTVMLNPCYVPCGSEYCYDCIKYLIEDSLSPACLCCKIIYKMENVSLNPAKNKNIKSLKMSCINEECVFQGNLEMFSQHNSKCEYRRRNCILSKGKCDEVSKLMTTEQMVTHLQHHSNKEVIDYIEKLQIENQQLKVQLTEIENHKNESLMNEEESESDENYKNEMRQLENENKYLKLQNEDLLKKFEKYEVDQLIFEGKAIDISERSPWHGIPQKNGYKMYMAPIYTSDGGYKIRFGVEYDSIYQGQYRLFVQIMKSPHDNRIQWPMKKKIQGGFFNDGLSWCVDLNDFPSSCMKPILIENPIIYINFQFNKNYNYFQDGYFNVRIHSII